MQTAHEPRGHPVDPLRTGVLDRAWTVLQRVQKSPSKELEVSEMFEVKDDWNVTLRRFDDRADAEDYIRQRGPERLHIVEGE
jgi:hypothetical protein